MMKPDTIDKPYPVPKKGNKYNPQTCNRSGETARRLRAIQRREAKSILKAQNRAQNQKLD